MFSFKRKTTQTDYNTLNSFADIKNLFEQERQKQRTQFEIDRSTYYTLFHLYSALDRMPVHPKTDTEKRIQESVLSTIKLLEIECDKVRKR